MQIEKTRKFLRILSLLGRSGTHFFLICGWLLGSHGHQRGAQNAIPSCSISSKVCNVWQSLTCCSLLYWPLSQLGSPLLHSIGHDDSMLAFPSCVLIPIGAFEGAAPDFRVPLESISKATSFVSFVAVR